ncbi:MAG TPA: hypothetical protein VF244_00935 [Acidimicrobiales bacterium]
MAGIVLAACGSSESNETTAPPTSETARSYVGTVEGTEAFVSVVFDGARALAYVCDGVPADPTGTTPTIQAWFNGPSDGATVDVQVAAGRLQLQLTDTDMAGTLTLPDGRRASVRGRSVAPDGDAGLYRAEVSGDGGTAVGGWILAADGQQRGGVGGTEKGGTTTTSGVRVLSLSQPTFTAQGLASARIAKVGITPIPIP